MQDMYHFLAAYWLNSLRKIKEILLKALRSQAQGHLQKHLGNLEVYFNNPVGIGEHSDLVEAMEKELDEVARYDDQLEMLTKYFKV